MAAVLYNCKRCKVGRRVEYPHPSETYRGCYWREGDDLDRRHPSTRVYPGARAYIVAGGVAHYEGDPLAMCPSCSRPMKWDYLQGRRNPDVRCDARCTHARGHSCECSCGGENHGKHWG